MFVRFPLFSFLAIAVSLLMALPADAQINNRRNPNGQQMQKIKTSGTLVSATANQIQLSTSTNETKYVMVGPNTTVSITGTAEPEYLKSGVCVEFVAEVAKGGAVKEKIDHLTIVTPTTDRAVGLYPPEFGAKKKDAKEDKGDKAKPVGHDPGIGDAGPAAGRNSRSKKDPDALGGDLLSSKPVKSSGATQFPGTFTVRGTIKMCKNGLITVSAGRGPTIKAELANDATIDVDMADLRVARRDDKITVNGFTTQMRPNLIMAESVTVDLANPLTGAKKHGTHRSKTPAAPIKPKKDAGGDDLPGGK